MPGRVSLSGFNPPEEHKVMGADGRFTFKGKPIVDNLSIHVHRKKRKNAKARPVKVVEPPKPPALHPSDLDNLLYNPAELYDKVGFTAKYKIKDLVVAIKVIEDEIAISSDAGPETLLEHFVRRAFKSDTVLKDLMRKLLPDLKHIDADIDVTEQFQLIIDATGDDDDDTVDVKALPAPKRRVKLQRKRKSA